MDHVHGIVDAVLEHLENSFGVGGTGSPRAGILSTLQSKLNASYKELPTLVAFGRKPSDIFLRSHLKRNSYPSPDKTQIGFGFDFYVDTQKLKKIEERYTNGDQKDLKNRNGEFGMEVIAELVGGIDIYREGLRHVSKGSMMLLGEDIVEAVYLWAKKVLGLDGSHSLLDFRRNITESNAARGCKIIVDEGGAIMASVVFQPGMYDVPPAPNSENPPAEPRYHYWTTPAPSRTRLSPNHSFYIDTIKLAEYQRYMGPESARKIKDWTVYARTLVQHAVGGEERFFKMCLERRKAKQSSTVIEASIREAIIEHVVDLFKAPAIVTEKSVRHYILNFQFHQMQRYDQGLTRWCFPELDERSKPEAVVLLEEQEYWRKAADGRTQLRPGHDVYIKTALLESVAAYFGPQSKENCIKQYSCALLMHMLGGMSTAYKLWHRKQFTDRLGGMFFLDDLMAVCLHSDEVFHLTVSISPLACVRFSCTRMTRYGKLLKKHETRAAQGARPRPARSLMHLALELP